LLSTLLRNARKSESAGIIMTAEIKILIVEDERDNVRRRTIREEDQTLAQIAGRDRAFEKKSEEEYSVMSSSKSGGGSVRASKEVQQMNAASNYAQARAGESRLNFRDSEGKVQNVTAQVKNIQGRAIYNVGKFWVDSRVQQQKNQQINRIQFASAEFFDLLKKKPLSAQLLALGKNIRFVLDNRIYEIYE